MQPLTSNDPVEIAGYRLRARLGTGGMGQVYLAFTAGGRAVAIKVVRPDLGNDAEFRNRFRQEVDAARRVHGLYTAQVLDADPAAAPPWLVTTYVPGPSLSQAVAEHGAMPRMTVLALLAGVAEALQAIHAAGIVHRDLKPSNVILAPDGPRVIDFGIARSVEAVSLTRTSTRVGSPQYMAPEQILGQAVSPALDVFALGSLAVYAVCGRPAFGEGDDSALLYRIVHQPADLSGVPVSLRPVIEGCLAKDPASRPTPHQIIASCREQTDGADQVGLSWLPPEVAATLAQHAAPASPAPAAPAPRSAAAPPAPADAKPVPAYAQPGVAAAAPVLSHHPPGPATPPPAPRPARPGAASSSAPTILAPGVKPATPAPPARPGGVRRRAVVGGLAVLGILAIILGVLYIAAGSSLPGFLTAASKAKHGSHLIRAAVSWAVGVALLVGAWFGNRARAGR